MFTRKVLYGAAALVLGLTACSSDEPINNGTQVAERDMTKFLKVAICTSGNNTRGVADPGIGDADTPSDFENGTTAENTISSAYLAFYDAAGNWIQTINITNPTFTDYTGDKPVEKVAEQVVPISLTKGQAMPAYVMCYLNPANAAEIMSGDGNFEEQPTMAELRNKTRDRFVSTNGNFSMNNSVYYGQNPITGEQNVKMTGAPIDIDQLYTSEKEAEDATDAGVDIYVERYCAKVNYNIAENGIKTVSLKNSTDTYSLTFVPEKWTVNADEQKMYLVKKFANKIDAIVPTLDAITTSLGTGWKWNQPEFFRSYWACSPNYYSTSFPQTSDQVVDAWLANKGTETKGNEATGAGIPYKNGSANGGLIYYSYNQITSTVEDIAFDNKTLGKDLGTPHYTMEGTMGKDALTSANPLACAPSALMVGKYTIEGVDEGTTFYNVGGKTGLIYFDDATNIGTISIDDYFLGRQNVVFERVAAAGEGVVAAGDGKFYKRVNTMAPFEIAHPSKEVRNVGADKIARLVDESDVTLQLTDEAAKEVSNFGGGNVAKYYIQTTFGVFTELNEAYLTTANQILWDGVGAAKKYTNGKAYFSLPIMHLGAFAANAPGIPADKSINNVEWDNVLPGAFGLVRNHTYNIQIDAINGLGTGIRDLDYPIVVPMTSDQYWFKYRINVQQWRIVPTQNATFN